MFLDSLFDSFCLECASHCGPCATVGVLLSAHVCSGLGVLPAVDSPLLASLVPRSAIPTDVVKEALGLNVTVYPYSFADVADDLRHQLFNLTQYDTSCDLVCRWQMVNSQTSDIPHLVV